MQSNKEHLLDIDCPQVVPRSYGNSFKLRAVQNGLYVMNHNDLQKP